MYIDKAPLRTESIIPVFRGVYLQRFLRLIEAIDREDALGQREAVHEELTWCDCLTHNTTDRLRYRATLMVLRDVMGQGWRTRYRQRSIFLTRPDYTHGKHLALDHVLVKGQIRSAFSKERLAKLTMPSAVRFIKDLECPKKGKHSILD